MPEQLSFLTNDFRLTLCCVHLKQLSPWIKICFCQQPTLKGLSQCSAIVGVCRHLSFKVQIGLYFETKYLKISPNSCVRWLRYGQFFLGLGRKRCGKTTCSIYALKPNIWKYFKCYVSMLIWYLLWLFFLHCLFWCF